MNRISKLATTTLATAGLGMAGLTLGSGEAGATGPYHWCPGDDPKGQFGELEYPPVIWDWNVCHTYHMVDVGSGNVSPVIWDGEVPPPRPPWWTCEMPQLPWNQAKCRNAPRP